MRKLFWVKPELKNANLRGMLQAYFGADGFHGEGPIGMGCIVAMNRLVATRRTYSLGRAY